MENEEIIFFCVGWICGQSEEEEKVPSYKLKEIGSRKV